MNAQLSAMLGRGGRRPSYMGGTDMGYASPSAAAPTAAPSGASANVSLGGVDLTGRISAAILAVAVIGLMGFYIGTRGKQL